MTQINDNIGSKYITNNNMVSVIFKYFINNITKGLIPTINADVISTAAIDMYASDIEYFLKE